jgi:PAS domain S-box-containing protein
MSFNAAGLISGIINKYVRGEKPLNVRVLNMLYLYGGAVAFLSCFTRIVENVSPLPVIVSAAFILLLIACFFLNNRYNIASFASALMCVVLGDVFLPIIFFTDGGTQSGVTAYFVCAPTLVFLTQRGLRRIIILLVNLTVIIACYIIESKYPGLVPPPGAFQRYINNIQSFFFAGILIGGILNFQRDIFESERRKNVNMQKNKLRLNELLNAINDASALLLTCTEANFTETMTRSISGLAACMNVDRAYIWKYLIKDTDETHRYAVLYEWAAGESLKQGDMTVPAVDVPPSWEGRFADKKPAGGIFSKMAKTDQEKLVKNGVKSILAVPVFIKDKFWGFVSFDDCHSEREFSVDETDLLLSGALLLVSAIERRNMQKQMRIADDRARAMIDSAPLGVFYFDENFSLIDCNAESLRIFGAKHKDELLEDFFRLSPELQPDGALSREKSIQLLRKSSKEGSCTYQWIHQTLTGDVIPCEITSVSVKRNDRNMMLVYVRDLREHQRMLAEIEKNDRLLYTVNAAASILLKSDPGMFEQALWQCFDMLGKGVQVNRIRVYQIYTECGEQRYTLKYEWSDAGGTAEDAALAANRGISEGLISLSMLPLWKQKLPAGECISGPISSFPEDVQSLLKKRGIVSILIVPVFLENKFWGFDSYENLATERLFSKKEESILMSGTLLLANAMTRNNMIQNLIIAREQALDNTRIKSAFLATISHEIRTPLNAIIGLTEIQMQNPLPCESFADMEKIHDSGTALLAIINDMLDISKIDAGGFELVAGEYDVPSMIADTILLNSARIGSKPVEFVIHVDAQIPSRLLGDELRVKQIIGNVLSNAFKYTREGVVELTLRFESDGADKRQGLLVTVRDTGIGIKEDDIDRLFSEYNQLDTRANRKTTGTGLGLSITKKLIELMGGSIEVESEYNKGSVFTLHIPQTAADGTPIGKETAKNLESFKALADTHNAKKLLMRANMQYARVLVVDDVQTNLDVAHGLMLPYGLMIDCALSGKEAIDCVKNPDVRYDAIFMDHMMPEMDGIETVRVIRSEIDSDYARTVPIIALTANAAASGEEFFIKQGFTATLSKPIDIMRLDAILNQFVRDKTLETGGRV